MKTLFKNVNSFQYTLPRKYKLFNESLCLVLSLLSAPSQLLISPQTYSTFLNFCFIFFTVHSPQNALIPSPALKIPFILQAHLKSYLCHKIFIDPTYSNDPPWHFINVFPMVEFILHCNVVICEFIVIMITVIPATRVET